MSMEQIREKLERAKTALGHVFCVLSSSNQARDSAIEYIDAALSQLAASAVAEEQETTAIDVSVGRLERQNGACPVCGCPLLRTNLQERFCPACGYIGAPAQHPTAPAPEASEPKDCKGCSLGSQPDRPCGHCRRAFPMHPNLPDCYVPRKPTQAASSEEDALEIGEPDRISHDDNPLAVLKERDALRATISKIEEETWAPYDSRFKIRDLARAALGGEENHA